MIKHRRLWIPFIAAVLIFSALPGSNAGNNWAPWLAPDHPEAGFLGIIVTDQESSFEQYSRLIANKAGSSFVCTSISGDCANANSYDYNLVLGPCSTNLESNCVSSLAATNTGGSASGEFISLIYPDHRNRFLAEANIGLPASSEPSIWSIPSMPHANGNLYAVVAGLNGTINSGQKITNSSLYARIIPVHKVNANAQTVPDANGAYPFPSCWNVERNGSPNIACNLLMAQGTGPNKTPCVLMVGIDPNCYVQDPFPLDTSFSLSLHLGARISGWLHGRLSNPNVAFTGDSEKGYVLNVTANPVTVPIFYAGDLYKNLPSNLQAAYATDASVHSVGGSTRQFGSAYSSDPSIRNFTLTPPPYGENAITSLSNWLTYGGNKSISETPSWEIHTLSTSLNGGANNCIQSTTGLVGLVSTNSTTYSDGAPSLVGDSLNYKVESAHYTSEGTNFLGTYDLNLRSDVARCIYGLSKAPIKATIEVVSSNGQQQVATSSFSESNGWIHFSADGFSFSAPTISVKLTQDAPAVVAPEAKPTVAPVAPKSDAKLITITCTKGKISKKVTAIKPTCPSGYKRK